MAEDGQPEVIYDNEDYRVEKVGIKTGQNVQYTYAVISNTYNVWEVVDPVLVKCLRMADELQTATNSFFQEKAFTAKKKEPLIIEG